MRKLTILLTFVILSIGIGLPASASTQQFVGVWKAKGTNKEIAIRRLDIQPNGTSMTVEAKGACKACKFGKTVGIPYSSHPRNNLAQDANAITAQFKHQGKTIMLVIRAAGNNEISVEYFESKGPKGVIAVTHRMKKAK